MCVSTFLVLQQCQWSGVHGEVLYSGALGLSLSSLPDQKGGRKLETLVWWVVARYLRKLEQFKIQVHRYLTIGASALGRPRGMVWGGRREEASGQTLYRLSHQECLPTHNSLVILLKLLSTYYVPGTTLALLFIYVYMTAFDGFNYWKSICLSCPRTDIIHTMIPIQTA